MIGPPPPKVQGARPETRTAALLTSSVDLLKRLQVWESLTPHAAPLKTVKAVNREIYGIRDEKQFYAFIRANMRPQPEEYAKIREINAGLVEVDEEQQDVMDLGKNECAASAMKK